jgi:hypothetical protein
LIRVRALAIPDVFPNSALKSVVVTMMSLNENEPRDLFESAVAVFAM